MVYLGMILAGCVIGLVAGLMSPESEKPKKPWKPKNKTSWEDRLGLGGDFWDYAS